MNQSELKDFLEEVLQYNTLDFIDSDPQIPHLYTKEDIEIAGFLSATIAWVTANDYQECS
jgi:hypothetical protein